MNNRLLINISIRLLLAWLVLSIAGIAFADQIVSVFLQFFTTIADKISTDYSAVVNISHYDNSSHIVLIANVIHPIHLSGEKFFPPGAVLTAGSDVVHTIVPMVILYTLLLAWPAKQLKERALLLATGFPMLFIVLGLTTPQLLAGRVAIQILERTAKAGGVPQEPFVIDWMIFAESGGSWLLAVAGAIVCIMLTKRLSMWLAEFSTIGVTVRTESTDRKPLKVKQLTKKSKSLPSRG